MRGKYFIPASLVLSVFVLGGGCASSSGTGGEVRAASEARPSVSRETSNEATPQEQASDRHVEPAVERRDEMAIREDGRPSWWFDGVLEEDGRVMVCAESIGADLAEARARALEEALRSLRDRLGLGAEEPVEGFEVERTWVWPIPHASGAARRYAGYVLAGAER